MLFLYPGAEIYPTKIGYYSIHYPDSNLKRTISEAMEIPVVELPFVYFEDRGLKAFRISDDQAKAWDLELPVIWART
jgi:hypothetical protein